MTRVAYHINKNRRFYKCIKGGLPKQPSSLFNARRHVSEQKMSSGFVEDAMDGVRFKLDITTTMAPRTFPSSPFGGRIEHKDAELVDVQATGLIMDDPDKVVYRGQQFILYMYSPQSNGTEWEMIHSLSKMLLPDTFVYEEAEIGHFRKIYDCPNGFLTCSQVVEIILDFERTSGHRSHKSWFGGIDCKWVEFEGICEFFEGVFTIAYGC